MASCPVCNCVGYHADDCPATPSYVILDIAYEAAKASIAALEAENKELRDALASAKCWKCGEDAAKLAHEVESNHISIEQWGIWEERAKQAEALHQSAVKEYDRVERENRDLSDKLEQAEAALASECRSWDLASNKVYELKTKLEQAEAEVERLKCCGTCKSLTVELEGFGCAHGDCMGPLYVLPEQRPCSFEPSRWAERGGAG